MRTKHALEHADVLKLVAAAKDEGVANGYKLTICVVDDGGNILHLERMDGTGHTTVDVAIGKARTAAFSGAPSRLLEEKMAARPSLMRLANLPMQGGMPVIHEGQCVGAIGISGATFDQDEEVATKAAAALG